MKHLENSMNYT